MLWKPDPLSVRVQESKVTRHLWPYFAGAGILTTQWTDESGMIRASSYRITGPNAVVVDKHEHREASFPAVMMAIVRAHPERLRGTYFKFLLLTLAIEWLGDEIERLPR